MFDKQQICEPIKLPESPLVVMHSFCPAILILKNKKLTFFNDQISRFKTSLKIKKMNLVNNQAGHETNVSQQFEHVNTLELKTVLTID